MDASWISTDFMALDKRDPVRRVQGWLQGETSRRPIIVDQGKPFAIVSSRAFVTHRFPENTRLDKVATPVPVVRANEDPLEVMNKMARAGVSYLPVLASNGKCQGFIDALTLLQRAAPPAPAPNAAQLMGEAPPLFSDGTIEDAIQLFAKQMPDVLRVIDARSRTIGVVQRPSVIRILQETDSGMGRKDFAGDSRPLRRQELAGIMTPGIIELDAQASYDDVLHALDRNGHAFVQQGGAIAGIVTPLNALRGLTGTIGTRPVAAAR